MPHHFKYKTIKVGAAPGTLVHVGEQRLDKPRITIVKYDADTFEELEVETIQEALDYSKGPHLTWINIDGLHDVDLIDRLGRHFEIHPLTLEDILNTAQRPKFEEFNHYGYFVLKMLRYSANENQVLIEQVSLILTETALISFQESRGDVFDSVRTRLRKSRGRIRTAASDYLAYALIDAVVDHYFTILEQIGTQIDEIENQIIQSPEPQTLQRLHDLKREVIYLRKQIWPLREVLGTLSKEDSAMIQDTTMVFLRDVHDHAIQIIETIESQRDLLAGLLDLYMTGISNRMNEVMKVLTIIATIFIPITFIAGVYGMNFKNIPELGWSYGYAMVWGIMISMVVLMVLYFKKKKWL